MLCEAKSSVPQERFTVAGPSRRLFIAVLAMTFSLTALVTLVSLLAVNTSLVRAECKPQVKYANYQTASTVYVKTGDPARECPRPRSMG